MTIDSLPVVTQPHTTLLDNFMKQSLKKPVPVSKTQLETEAELRTDFDSHFKKVRSLSPI